MTTLTLVERPELKESLLQTLRRPSQLRAVPEIRIASYNAYNLFDKESERAASAAQMRALGSVILGIRPHVIAFAEVENEQVIRRLFSTYVNSELDDDDKYDGFVCLAGNDKRGINVALVTKLSIRGVMTFHDREFDSSPDTQSVKFSRDLLGVDIQITDKSEDRYIHFAAHLKSKIGGQAAAEKRGMEATEIAGIFTEGAFGRTPFIDQPMLLTGDMNDDPDSAVIETLSASGLADMFAGEANANSYPTRIHEGKKKKHKYPPTRLDYLFASPSMASRLSNLKVHRKGAADKASDHYPISATLRVR